MRQELTIFSAGAIFIVLVALIVTISTAVSSVIAIFNGFPQISNAIWVGGMVVFLIFALVGAFCFKVTK
nr:MAG TPA: Membrane fusion protein p14 fusion protein transmembrane domain [Caudoviricetes sp.]